MFVIGKRKTQLFVANLCLIFLCRSRSFSFAARPPAESDGVSSRYSLSFSRVPRLIAV